MIRTLVEATTDPASVHPDLAAHQAQIIDRCPYFARSVGRGLTTWSAVEAGPEDEPALFALLVAHAEQVRGERRVWGPLVCHLVALVGPGDEWEAKRLMERPVWIARNLYAPVQVRVDRFWIGAGRRPAFGRVPLPHVPVSYFMVRCAIASRDRVIVSPRPADELAALHAGPGDDGRDIAGPILGRARPLGPQTWTRLLQAFPVPSAAR
jgi:hypothetical protein